MLFPQKQHKNIFQERYTCRHYVKLLIHEVRYELMGRYMMILVFSSHSFSECVCMYVSLESQWLSEYKRGREEKEKDPQNK